MSDKKITDQDYLFLSAMVKAREAKMLTAEALERMLTANSFGDAAKVLMDSGYADMSGFGAAEIENALSTRRSNIFREIASLQPETGVAEAFELKYDYHNAKVVIKSRGVGVNGEYMLSNSGRIKAQTMVEAYDTDDYRFISRTLANAMIEARGILARTNNPQLADLCLDKAYFAEMRGLANDMSGNYLNKYVETLIDGANIRAAVRTVRMGRGMEFLKIALVEGGDISVDRVAIAALGENLGDLFSGTVYAEAAKLGDGAGKGGELTTFEMACDNAIVAFMRDAKLMSFGDAPVIAYLAAVESELTAVRMILTGRLAGITPESIRERLRVSYV